MLTNQITDGETTMGYLISRLAFTSGARRIPIRDAEENGLTALDSYSETDILSSEYGE
jgi:hypothetical protein